MCNLALRNWLGWPATGAAYYATSETSDFVTRVWLWVVKLKEMTISEYPSFTSATTGTSVIYRSSYQYKHELQMLFPFIGKVSEKDRIISTFNDLKFHIQYCCRKCGTHAQVSENIIINNVNKLYYYNRR